MPMLYCLLSDALLSWCLMPYAYCLMLYAHCLISYVRCLMLIFLCLMLNALCLMSYAHCLISYVRCLKLIFLSLMLNTLYLMTYAYYLMSYVWCLTLIVLYLYAYCLITGNSCLFSDFSSTVTLNITFWFWSLPSAPLKQGWLLVWFLAQNGCSCQWRTRVHRSRLAADGWCLRKCCLSQSGDLKMETKQSITGMAHSGFNVINQIPFSSRAKS